MAIPPWPRPPADDDDDKYAAGNAKLRQAYLVLLVIFGLVVILWFVARFVDALGEPDAPAQPTRVAAGVGPARVPSPAA